jgi:hypothetical protein
MIYCAFKTLKDLQDALTRGEAVEIVPTDTAAERQARADQYMAPRVSGKQESYAVQ